MNSSPFDLAAVVVALLVAITIAGTLIVAHRGERHRRGWLAAAALFLGLGALAAIDLLRASPRESHLGAALSGILFAVLGTLGMVRGTRRVRPWLRWLMCTVSALVLLLAGLMIGAAFVSRVVPF